MWRNSEKSLEEIMTDFITKAANEINDNWVECKNDQYQSRVEYSCIFCEATSIEVWDDEIFPDLNKVYPHKTGCIVLDAKRVIREQIIEEHKEKI
jgi:hypothetical protein